MSKRYIEALVDSETGVNDCDGQELWWKCPRCGHQHCQGDVFEWLDTRISDVSCDGCGTKYNIEVHGDYAFYCLELGFSEKAKD